MTQFDDLSPEVIERILNKNDVQNIAPTIVMYVLQIDSAAKLFKGNITKAATELCRLYPALTHRNAKERIHDAIKYLHAGETALPSKYWHLYYADKYEAMAELYAKTPSLARFSLSAIDRAYECRLKAAENGIPMDLLETKIILTSPDTPIDRLSIRSENLQDAWKNAVALINDCDVSETDRLRLCKETAEELDPSLYEEIKSTNGNI